jgi:hypothetical protein
LGYREVSRTSATCSKKTGFTQTLPITGAPGGGGNNNNSNNNGDGGGKTQVSLYAPDVRDSTSRRTVIMTPRMLQSVQRVGVLRKNLVQFRSMLVMVSTSLIFPLLL